MTALKKETKSSERAQATRNHIINTYLKLMRHHVWNRITVKNLCEEAAVTRGTFYQYFDSIIDLMENIENETLSEIQAELYAAKQQFKPARVLYTPDFDRDYNVRPSEYSLRWFRYCQKNAGKLLALLDREFSDKLFIDRVRQILSHGLEHSMNYEGLPDDAFRFQYLTLYTDMYLNAVFSWLATDSGRQLTAEDIALVAESIRTGGLYTARRNRMEDFSNKKM